AHTHTHTYIYIYIYIYIYHRPTDKNTHRTNRKRWPTFICTEAIKTCVCVCVCGGVCHGGVCVCYLCVCVCVLCVYVHMGLLLPLSVTARDFTQIHTQQLCPMCLCKAGTHTHTQQHTHR